jgi:hypothetical protein
MKILKKVEWKHQVICGSCKAELELEASDILFYGGSEYPIWRKEVFYCKCANCGQDIDFHNHEFIPKHIQDSAVKKWRLRNPN